MEYRTLWQRLSGVYDEHEARAVVAWLLDVKFGLSLTDVYCGALQRMDQQQTAVLQGMMERLEKGEPVQYVAGVADFCGRLMSVGPGVLIPRPETAELCAWVIEEAKDRALGPELLDVGTGSGCIAVTLALEIAGASVTGWDISDHALRTAAANATRHGASVKLERQDALNPPTDTERWDIIVSNPPYIDETRERAAMASNVLDYEPHEALFGPADQPDLFYRRIAQYAIGSLRQGGRLYFELNPLWAESIGRHLEHLGFSHIEIRADQQGRLRMMRAIKMRTVAE